MRAWRWAAGAVVVVLVVGACGGGDDDSAAEDDRHEHEHPAALAADSERCDHGVNTATFNETTTLVDSPHLHQDGEPVDFTLREWAEVFAAGSGIPVDAITAHLESGDPLNGQEILAGEATHTLGPSDWVPTTDPDDCDKLADELQQAREAAARYPTVADALAAGYRPGSFYSAGSGAHYVRRDIAGDMVFDPSQPELLMFDGHEPTDHLVGAMYFLLAPDGLPEGEDFGFTGTNDVWHSHAEACRTAAGVGVPRTECRAGRATMQDASAGWMSHAWVVPGCESDWGVFSEANPKLPILMGRDADLVTSAATSRTPFESGCNSGIGPDAPLQFDSAGDDPAVR